MSNKRVYPWLEKTWLQLQSLKAQSRLPHAVMLRGLDGLAIEQLATAFATSMLCKKPTTLGYACGDCIDCKLLDAGTHPDFHKITPPEDKKQINVETIRTLIKACTERPHQGGYRVAVIDPAAAMNIAAANALLKTLEEPGDNTLIILVSSATSTLPATVRSRCLLLTIDAPAEAQALEWLHQNHPHDDNSTILALRLSSHAPLKAVSLLSSEKLHVRQQFLAGLARAAEGHLDPIKLVAKVNKLDISDCIDWMYSIALDAEKLVHKTSIDRLTNNDQSALVKLVAAQNTLKLDAWVDQITEARRLLATTSNINPQLITEDIVFRWIAIFK